MQLIAAVVDHAVDGGAEHRTAHDAVAQHHAPRRLVEVDAHARKFHDVALDLRIARVDGVLQLRFVMDGKLAHRDRALLHRIFGGRRIHRDHHLPAGHARIDVGEAEQGAAVAGGQRDHLASAGAAAQVAGQRRVAADLGGEPKTADFAGAARHFQVEAAQRLAVIADDGAELHVEIDIDRTLARRAAGRAAGHGLDEAAAVIDVAAHDHAQRAVGGAIDFQVGAVAVGKAVGRESRRLQFARAVELDGAFDAAAGALDQKIVDADRLRLGGERERRPRRLAGRLDPAGQEAVDLRRRQVRLDGEFAVTVRPGADAAGELERNAAADGVARIEAEIGSRIVVEHALQADVGSRRRRAPCGIRGSPACRRS